MSEDFLNSLKPVDLREFVEEISKRHESESSEPGKIWVVRNEIRPLDLFCYLGARFGPPNGLQNLLRNDSSDNLIHWEWALKSGDGFVLFQGMNFRSEIHLIGSTTIGSNEVTWLVEKIKKDLKNYGPEMSHVRKHLEHWDEFINPYQRIRSSIDIIKSELDALGLNPEHDQIPDIDHHTDIENYKKSWDESNERYPKGIGLCFGLRAMTPVLAESFINLIIFILMKPDIKTDARLAGNIYRQQIDIRVKSLHLNCIGFATPVDYEQLSDFHSLMMRRNDLLHGNVALQELVFGDTYFLGRIPVFKKYISFWDRAHGAMLSGVGFEHFVNDLKAVENMQEYILSLLADDVKENIEHIMNSRELGIERTTKRLGVLFSNHLADFKLGMDDGADDP